jgi:rhamnogalacturonyl hydrolase YesR
VTIGATAPAGAVEASARPPWLAPLELASPTTGDEPQFGAPLDSHLPRPLRIAWQTITGAIHAGADLLLPDETTTPPAASLRTPLERAEDAQRALVDEHAFLGSSSRFHAGDSWSVWPTEVWPLGQVLHGQVALAMQDGDWQRVESTMRELESYRVGNAFAGGTGSAGRYYDDNAWIGLAAMQAYSATGDERYLRHAERTFSMVASGSAPGGGVYWLEQDRSTRNTCSTAPAAQLAMRLYDATGDDSYLRFAIRQAEWLDSTMLLPSGLYADNVGNDGRMDRATWTYNQGTPIGLHVQLYRATGDERWLQAARRTADAALEQFTGDRLWKQPPAFNAIFFRNLLALDATSHDQRYVDAVDAYLDRAWNEGRDPETGLFDQGGIGHYGDEAGNVLDQGALSQLFAVRGLDRSQWSTIT